MEILSANLMRVWNEWGVRTLVLTSLFIQMLLISTVSIKNRASRKLSFLIWLCYLLADSVATFALGTIANNLLIKNSTNGDGSGADELKVVWAPFLLLHLGGPDNITAFSLEDNELWSRHLLQLLFQVGTAFYIFFSSLRHHQQQSKQLWVITILMFVAGIIKYVERTLALMNASQDHFRKSMVTHPDPGPDYAEVVRRQRCQPMRPPTESALHLRPRPYDAENTRKTSVIWRSHYFFQKLKHLIVDLVLTYNDAVISWSVFTELSWKEAYKLIEIELGFLYEVLYTKAVVVRSLKGLILRLTSVSSIIAASIIFFAFNIYHDNDEDEDDQERQRIDVIITYVLLSGAIALEFWSITRLIVADWTIVWIEKNAATLLVLRLIPLHECFSYLRPPNRSRWSNSMAQYNLIEFCLKDIQPRQSLLFWGHKVMKLLKVKDLFDKHWHTTYKNISVDLKKFVFEDMKCKLPNLRDNVEAYRNFKPGRGQLALERINSRDEILDNSISKAEFDESILLWHIATDICYHLDETKFLEKEAVMLNQISRDISNYMLYLLVSRPFMLTSGIGQIRFVDTCADAKRFFAIKMNKKRACESLYAVDTKIPPKEVKGDQSQSVLFDAVRVAKSLLKQEPDLKKRWTVICLVWSEMLCYAAIHCRGYNHAQRLAAGGELLTVVYCLMAHLGMGEQYRVFFGEFRGPELASLGGQPPAPVRSPESVFRA